MSPACIATIYEGDNGGATSRGVSSTEIRVAVPGTRDGSDQLALVQALFEYVNQRFEFYGRRLVAVPAQGGGSVLAERTMAAEIAAQQVFGALTGIHSFSTPQASLPLELARQEVTTVVLNRNTWWSDRALFDLRDPYVWSVYPSAEDVQANLAAFACASLAGRPARHAGDTGLQEATRRFGIVTTGVEVAPVSNTVRQDLAACTGVDPARTEWTRAAGTTALQTAIERMRSDGTTTLLCVCASVDAQTVLAAAYTARFYPEWILTPSSNAPAEEAHWLQARRATGQVAPPMRMSAGPRVLPVQARPWFAPASAVLSSRPGNVSYLFNVAESFYPELLVLASGIQTAGPNLTPQTFAQGLLSTSFPNPGAGQAPFYQPSAGFGPGDHSFYDDYTVAWWSDTADPLGQGITLGPAGSWCYVDQAARFRIGTYPTDADQRLFNPDVPCR